MAAELGLEAASIDLIVRWSEAHGIVREVYLFGSRARGDHRPDSDVDRGIVLTPGGSARGLYEAKGDGWQRKLTALVGMRVRAIDPAAEHPKPIVALWQRPEAASLPRCATAGRYTRAVDGALRCATLACHAPVRLPR